MADPLAVWTVTALSAISALKLDRLRPLLRERGYHAGGLFQSPRSRAESTRRRGQTHGATERLRVILSLLLIAPGVGIADDSAFEDPARQRAEDTRASVNVSVLYATNRKRHRAKAAADTYGGERGGAQFGRCEVAFRPIPLVNRLTDKVPFYLPSETNELRAAEPAEPAVFWQLVRAETARTTSSSVVVFVHGYNYGFERTCRMAAELQRILAGQTALAMFSWPANGLPTDYVMDLADVDWSTPFLARFLKVLGDNLEAENVHVLAHSLGSRGVIHALERLRADQGEQAVIGRLILLAPDYDSQTFIELLPRVLPLVAGITLYASSNDTPLKASRQLNGYPRLGEAGEYLTVVPGVETIDVSPVGRYQILGHEYFYYHPLVSADLVRLLTTGEPAAQRPGLRSKTKAGSQYWEIDERRERRDTP